MTGWGSCPVNDCCSSTTRRTCARCSRRRCATTASRSPRRPTAATRSTRWPTVQPDLIVLDVMLPDLDGFEVCRRLRADGVPHAGAVPHGPRRHRRQGARADARRRRLPGEAVQPRRAGRPRRGGAAPGRADPRRSVGAALRRPGDGRRRAPRDARRRRGVAVTDRVQPAALPAAQPGPGALEGADPRSRLAVRLRRRRRRRRDLHRLPATQGRQRRTPADPHHPGRRLHAARPRGRRATHVAAQPSARRDGARSPSCSRVAASSSPAPPRRI